MELVKESLTVGRGVPTNFEKTQFQYNGRKDY